MSVMTKSTPIYSTTEWITSLYHVQADLEPYYYLGAPCTFLGLQVTAPPQSYYYLYISVSD